MAALLSDAEPQGLVAVNTHGAHKWIQIFILINNKRVGLFSAQNVCVMCGYVDIPKCVSCVGIFAAQEVCVMYGFVLGQTINFIHEYSADSYHAMKDDHLCLCTCTYE